MTNHKSPFIALALTALCATTPFILSGCGEDEDTTAVAPPPPPPPAPPPKQAPTTIEELMAAHNIDPRVHLPEERAPESTETRIALLKFFDAFARGNDGALRSYLAEPDKFGLDQLVKSGQFAELASKIKAIDIQTGDGLYDKVCALAVFDLSAGAKIDFQPQLWSYTGAAEAYVFQAEPCPPGMIDKLSGSNWIMSWFEVLKREDELAQRADDVIVIKKRVIENPDNGSVSSGGSEPDAPSAPGGRPVPGEPIEDPSRMPG